MRQQSPVLFQESMRFPLWLNVSNLAVAIAVLAFVGRKVISEGAFTGFAVVALVVGVAALMALVFVHGKVTLEGSVLRLSVVPLWRKTVPLAEVVSATRTTAGLFEFGGFGYRIAPGRRHALVMQAGPAIRLETESARSYTVGTARIEEFAAALEAANVRFKP